MPWKRFAVVAAVVLIVVAFLAGYLPERSLRVGAEQESLALRERLAAADSRIRIGQLLGQALTLKEVAMRQDYGQAQELSSTFFDNVREAAPQVTENTLRAALTDILARRDSVTVSLTKADPVVIQVLHAIELRLRSALGYALPPEPNQARPPET